MGRIYTHKLEGIKAMLEYVDLKKDFIRLKCVESPFVFESNRTTVEYYWTLDEEKK
jgi:hypothetical protein